MDTEVPIALQGGSMPGSVSRFYRRPPGAGWLVALAVIPLLLAMIGLGMADRSKLDSTESSVAAPPVPTVDPSGLSFAPLSILRNGNVITVNGELSDIATRTWLFDMLKAAYGERIQLVDNLTIKPGAQVPDIAALTSVFTAASTMPDFRFKINGDTVTLIGTAASGAVKSAVEAAAKAAWPNLELSNNILVLPDAAPAPASPPR
nr:hypothetical protein [Mycolicibacter terrae]